MSLADILLQYCTCQYRPTEKKTHLNTMRFTVHPHERREQFLSCMFQNKHCQSYQANEPGCFFYHSQKFMFNIFKKTSQVMTFFGFICPFFGCGFKDVCAFTPT